MGNLKVFLVIAVCGLPLLSIFVPFGLSSITETVTATEQCQCMTLLEWIQLTCALYNGVDISVGRGNPEIPAEIRTAPLDETVVPLLLSQTGTRLENLLAPNYHYHPRLTAAIMELEVDREVDDQNPHYYYFLSEEGRGAAADNRHHAEARSLHLLSFLNETGELEWPVKYINISNSPCKECARDLIKAFKGKEKPAINFLWVYGSPSSLSADEKYAEKQVLERIKKFISAIQSLEELVKAGFKVGLWDWKDFSNFLKRQAPTEELDLFTNSIRKYAKRLNTRGKITKESIDIVNRNYAFFTSELNENDDEPEDGGGGGGGGGDDDGDGGRNHEGSDEKENEESQGGLRNFLSSVVSAIIKLVIDITVMGPRIIYMTKLNFFMILATTACLGVLIGFICRPFIPLQLYNYG